MTIKVALSVRPILFVLNACPKQLQQCAQWTIRSAIVAFHCFPRVIKRETKPTHVPQLVNGTKPGPWDRIYNDYRLVATGCFLPPSTPVYPTVVSSSGLMTTVDQRTKVYCLAVENARAYRLAADNLPFFYDEETIIKQQDSLDHFVAQVDPELFPFIGFVIEQLLKTPQLHVGATVSLGLDDLFQLFGAFYCRKNPGAS